MAISEKERRHLHHRDDVNAKSSGRRLEGPHRLARLTELNFESRFSYRRIDVILMKMPNPQTSTPQPAARALRSPGSNESRRGGYAKSRETRARILRATIEIAGEKGIHRTSVAKIADRAGVAVGNLHYHFGSRGDLLRETMAWIVGELLAEVERAAPAGPSMLEREEASFRTYLAYVHRNPSWIRVTEEVRTYYPDLYRETMSLWLTLFRGGISDGIASGELRPMSVDEVNVLAHFLLGARYFLDQLIATGDEPTYPGDDMVVATYMKLIRSGLERADA